MKLSFVTPRYPLDEVAFGAASFGIVGCEDPCTANIRSFTHDVRGTRGFGYDPLFIPVGESRTVAEMTDEEKNAISHRARALSALLAKLEVK